MNDVERDVLDRLIEEGLALYGQGDLDGALVIWERVLSEDPGNAQATSYVDYVRTNYDTLTTEGQEPADPGPFALAADADPGYVIEVTVGAQLEPGTPTSLANDGVDAGWADEASEQDTLDLAAASPEALTLTDDGFDDATREYDPSMRAAPTDEGPFAEKTSVRKRDLGFVQPSGPIPRRAVSEGDFEPPTREHQAVGPRELPPADPSPSGGARDITSFELDQPIAPPAPSSVPTRELDLATAPTRDLPGTFDALVSAPTRELGLRQLATQPTELHEAPDPRGATRADIVLPFDPIDARAAQILDSVDEGAPPNEPKDEQTRRRITRLMERASAWSAAGDLDRAVAAVDLALDEDPNSALAQKLIQRHRETTQHVFLSFLGDLSRQPMLARPLHELASAPIGPRAAFLLSRVDGTLSIDEILDVSGMPRLEAYRYLCQLFLRGILR